MIRIWWATGDLKQRFKKTDMRRIKQWAVLSKVTVEDVIASGEIVDDPVLGEAWEFPCIIIYQ